MLVSQNWPVKIEVQRQLALKSESRKQIPPEKLIKLNKTSDEKNKKKDLLNEPFRQTTFNVEQIKFKVSSNVVVCTSVVVDEYSVVVVISVSQ